MNTRLNFVTVLFLLCVSTVCAQNIQLHYDFGRTLYPNEERERPRMTATYEQFRTDAAGSWFYFADFDFYGDGMAGAYTEISREFNIGNQGFAAHVEYDGGLTSSKAYYASRFQHAALIGAAWNGHNVDFTHTYSLQLLYKQYFRGQNHTKGYASVQLTGVWSLALLNKAVTFSGYIDFWRGQNSGGSGKLVMMGEPQLWFNFNSINGLKSLPLSVGTEIEVSNNFIYNVTSDKTFFVNPTLAIKYSF